jgi:hypothetical protein
METVSEIRICDDFALFAKVHQRQDEVDRGDDFVLLNAKFQVAIFEDFLLERA